jgi:acyl carrier protein
MEKIMNKGPDITETIISIVLELSAQRDAADLQDDVNLIGDNILDSLGFLTLAARVQQALGIEIPFDDYSPEEFTVFGKFVEICKNTFMDRKIVKD